MRTAILILGLALAAAAQSPSITEYPLPAGLADLTAIAAGPDGAVWFTANRETGALGRITASGSVTKFAISGLSGMGSLDRVAIGPDGALWVTSAGPGFDYISRLDSREGVNMTLSLQTGSTMGGPQSGLASLANGPDGAFWCAVPLSITMPVHGQSTAGGYVAHLTTDGVTSNSYTTTTTSTAGGPYAVAPGSGAVWFTELGAIGRIVPSTGAITEFALPRATTVAGSIVTGPDGAMWFTEDSESRIGRLNWDGDVTEYALPNSGSYPTSITQGPDGALWFVEAGVLSDSGQRTGGNRIGRITADGVIAEYAIPTAASGLTALTAAGDGSLWFTENAANQIGKLVAVASLLSINAPSSIASGTVGGGYPTTALQAQGGTAPYLWSATGLPPGMTLSGAGVLSGAPSISGNYTVAVQVSDSSTPALVARRLYSLSVNSAPALTIATAGTLPEATVGAAYTATLSALGGTPPYTWSATGALPAGLNLDSTSGIISGTPVTAGSNRFSVVVTDSAGGAATLDATLTVAAAGSGGMGGSAPRSGVLSQVAYGGGWQSSIYLINPSASALSLSLNFHSDSGGALSLPLVVTQGANSQWATTSTVSATLAAYSAMVVTGDPNVVSNAAETSGWAEVLSAQPVEGYAVFHYTSLAGVQSEGTVPLETTQASSFVLPFDNLSHFQTGVALTNLSPQAALVAVTIWDENGKQIGVQSIQVAAGGHASFMLSDRLPATAALRGMLQFHATASGNVTGLGLRVDPLGGFTSIPKMAGIQ